MRTLVQAIEAEDEPAIAASFYIQDDPEQRLPHAVARVMIASQQYWQAAWQRFGRGPSIEAYVQRRIVLPDVYLEYPYAKWEFEDDKAFVKSGKALGPLRRLEGEWRVDYRMRLGPGYDHAVAKCERDAQQFAQLAADIEAGKLKSIHEAIDVLYPQQRKQEHPRRPEYTKEQLDPATIPGAMLTLGLATESGDQDAIAKFFHSDGPLGPVLVKAHVRHTLAVQQFAVVMSALGDGSGVSLSGEFGLDDPRNDIFGHLITEWKIEGDRATGTNEAGPASAELRRVDGAWRIDLTPAPDGPPAERVLEQLQSRTRAVSEVTRAVQKKKLFTVDEVREELKAHGLTPMSQDAGGAIETK